MAIVYSLVCENGSSGTYWSGLSAAEKERYGASGSERVYGGLYDALEAMKTASRTDDHIVEIGEAFTDTCSTQFIIDYSYLPGHITIQPMVDGVLTSAFHYGDSSTSSGGYIWDRPCYDGGVIVSRANVTIWGIKVLSSHSYMPQKPLYITGSKVSIFCCIFALTGTGSGNLFSLAGGGNTVSHCVFFSTQSASVHGLYLSQYSGSGNMVAKCLFHGVTGTGNKGAYIQGSASNYNSVVGCIVFGFSTNWDAQSTVATLLANNAGETCDTPWDTEGGSSFTGVDSSWFANLANRDYRPASSSSPQVGSGFAPYGIPAVDCANNVRPNYNPSGEEEWDVGPFEYDHGNGVAPVNRTLTLSANVSLVGAEIRIYDLDGATGDFGTELAGTESHTSVTYSYTDTTTNLIHIQIMLDGYEEFNLDYTLDSDVTLPITLNADNNI